MIIDSHCHLDYQQLYENLDDVIKRAEAKKINCFLTICTTLESFDKIKLIASGGIKNMIDVKKLSSRGFSSLRFRN